MAFRHLKFLEKYGYLRNKKFMNKKAYFLYDSDKSQDEKILVLKNERTQAILDQITINKKVRLVDIENGLKLSHGQIQPHIKKLLEYDLINSIVENNITYYTPIISVSPEQVPDKVMIKREFDYVGGNIRFKVAVQNNTNMSISNILVTLNPSDQFFWEENVQKVPNLPPHNSRGVDFTLIPNTCGKSTIFGAVSYQDAFGNARTETIEPKEIAIKCPLVIPQKMTRFEINEWIKNLRKSSAKIDYGDIAPSKAYKMTLSLIEALDLSKIEENPQDFSALYSGKVKVTGQQIVVKLQIDQPYIILDVWANDLTQTTGLLAYIRNMITMYMEDALKSLEKSEEIARKITEVFNYNNELRNCFDICCNSEQIKKITTAITKIKHGLEQYYSELKALSSMNRWLLKLKGMFDEESCIEMETAIELEWDLIEWLKQIRELVTYDIKLYKDNYKDIDKYMEDFKIGEENINNNLELIEKIYGLSILNYVIVMHRENGLAIYQQQLGPVSVDADLISGFVTAIQSFGTEISKKKTPVRGLKYENYNLEVENGDYIQSILLLNGKANAYLVRCLFDFVREFETKYEGQLKTFSGNVAQFEEAHKLFRKAFNLPESNGGL